MASINKRKGLITGTDAVEDYATVYCEVIVLCIMHGLKTHLVAKPLIFKRLLPSRRSGWSEKTRCFGANMSDQVFVKPRVLGHGCFALLFICLVLIPASCFVVLFSVLFRLQLSVVSPVCLKLLE